MKMSMKIQSFGGRVGWITRKIAPALAGMLFTTIMFKLRRKRTLRFINDFFSSSQQPKPLIVGIETINRCNGTCSFCPSNINDEIRPYKKMSEALFLSIVEQLVDWGYSGRVMMCANNEPFLDTRITEWTRHIRERLPDANIYVITNGTLLTVDNFREIAPFMDEIQINNYSDKMRLHDNIREIVQYVRKNPEEFKHLVIDIQYRYNNEVLSNRNGNAPNKLVNSNSKIVHEPCFEPFVSMTIYPDGIIGICCFDAVEKSNLGDCNINTLEEIWNSDTMNSLRHLMRKDRSEYEFCKYCDGFSKVIRTKLTQQ